MKKEIIASTLAMGMFISILCGCKEKTEKETSGTLEVNKNIVLINTPKTRFLN